jgi:aspartate aminotransferase-like enzyme
MAETIVELAAAFDAKSMTSTALVERSLARIGRLDRRLNSFVAIDESGAMAAATDYSSSLTAVRLAEGHSADKLRALILPRFNMSLGNGLGILKDRVFRIGHLGDFNDLTLIGALSGVEMGLKLAKIPYASGGIDAAMAVLTDSAVSEAASGDHRDRGG